MPERPSGAAAASRANPLKFLADQHVTGLALCDMLEGIADSLPESINKLTCQNAIDQIQVNRLVHSCYESKVLFPLLRRRVGDNDGLFNKLARLDAEHIEDDGYAAEIIESLEALISNRNQAQAETLAYMLRGYFEGLRRHIAFERELVMPLARSALTASDLHEMEETLLRLRRNPECSAVLGH